MARSLLWRLPRIEKFCQALANCTDWSPPDPMIRAGSMLNRYPPTARGRWSKKVTAFLVRKRTAARNQDLASSQLKRLPVRHELSMGFFHPLNSVDMDLVLRSYSPTKALRTFARRARLKGLLRRGTARSKSNDDRMYETGSQLSGRRRQLQCAAARRFERSRVQARA